MPITHRPIPPADNTSKRVGEKPFDPNDGVQLTIGLICMVAGIAGVVGLFMGFLPASSSSYVYDQTAAALRLAARQENGRWLALLGAIVASGTGIVLVLRARLIPPAFKVERVGGVKPTEGASA